MKTLIFNPKRILHCAIPLFFSTLLCAQNVPNPGFETSTDSTADQWNLDPYGSLPSNAYANTGSYSLGVWNWYYYAKGFAHNGNDVGYQFEKSGTPVTGKPEKLTGFYVYDTTNTQSENDSAVVMVLLKKFNGSSIDTIGFGEIHLPATPNLVNFVPFEVNIEDYQPGIDPDSVVILLRSSIDGFCSMSSPGTCLYAWFDDLVLVDGTGIEQPIGEPSAVLLYPNPASDVVIIQTGDIACDQVQLRNLEGKIVYQQSIHTRGSIPCPVNDLTKGMYSVELLYQQRVTGRQKLVLH